MTEHRMPDGSPDPEEQRISRYSSPGESRLEFTSDAQRAAYEALTGAGDSRPLEIGFLPGHESTPGSLERGWASLLRSRRLLDRQADLVEGQLALQRDQDEDLTRREESIVGLADAVESQRALLRREREALDREQEQFRRDQEQLRQEQARTRDEKRAVRIVWVCALAVLLFMPCFGAWLYGGR